MSLFPVAQLSRGALRTLVVATTPLLALWLPLTGVGGFFYAGTSLATVPWTNGIVPYQFHTNLTAAQTNTYLDGLREWELGANVKFIPRSNQTQYVLFKYDPFGPNHVSGANPQVVEINSLSRVQICHEMGHSFGFTHENIRPDQTNYVTILTNNVIPGQIGAFVIDPSGVTNGAYDFESVMHLPNNFASISPNLYTQLAKPGYERFQPRMGGTVLSKGDRAALTFLYGPPAVPLTNIVTTTADTAPGSLRAALHYAVDHPGTTIRFNIPTNDAGFSNGVFTIHLTGHLPPLVADGTVIDGSTQPGFTNKPLIVVDGSELLPQPQVGFISGLLIFAANCAVKNISFTRFNWNGITMRHADATNNTIAGCWSGVDWTGTNAAPNAFQGILIFEGASRNIIGGTNAVSRNVLSGNTEYGIWIGGTNTVGNMVLGNYLGTDWTGSLAVTNRKSGVIAADGARDTVIGGTNAGARNVISGNRQYGIFLGDVGTTGTAVRGNFIGTDALGSAAVPNDIGVGLIDHAQGITIGGPDAAARNVISGNRNTGVWLEGVRVSNNVVQGNYVGLNAAGTSALANSIAGMQVLNGAASNLVAGNVISGNGSEGLRLSGAGVSGNVVQGNLCGTGPFGTNSIANGFAGVTLYGGAVGNSIGGPTPTARNILSGNGTVGFVIANPGASSNLVQGNFIGTDVSGSAPVPNGFAGVYLTDGAHHNTFGGTAAGAGNVVSGNWTYGLFIADAATSSNRIEGNFIGTRADGTNALANWVGVILLSGAHHNAIGLALDGSGAGNRVAFNFSDGVRLDDSATIGNTIRGNDAFSNGGLGINLSGGTESSGVTANDTGDGDGGPNNLQNFPVITNAYAYPSTTTILGTLNSASNRAFLIDVYRNASADASGYGEGQNYVGSASLTTSASGNGSFALVASGNFAGQRFTATATDTTTGDTSEFGLAVRATNAPPPPQFLAPMALTSTGFIARVSLNLGQSYRIQATTNLATNPIPWIDLTNFVANTTNFPFLDQAATNRPMRFYRAVSP